MFNHLSPAELIVLKQKLKEKDIEYSDHVSTLEDYATDASIFKVEPSIVVFVKTTKDIKNLVKITNQLRTDGIKLNLTVRAAGTCMSGGPLGSSIIIDTTTFYNRIISYDNDEKTITVEPGLLYKNMEAFLNVKGLLYAPYTSSKHWCAIGGLLGNNASGEKSLRYGANIDNIESVTVVAADSNEYTFREINHDELKAKLALDNFEGHLYREVYALINDNLELINDKFPTLHKNAAGYQIQRVLSPKSINLAPVFIGAQGTLGIISKATLRLIDKPKGEYIVAMSLKKYSDIPQAVKDFVASGAEGVETFDLNTILLAERYLPQYYKYLPFKDAKLIIFGIFNEHSDQVAFYNANKCLKKLMTSKSDAILVSDNNIKDALLEVRRYSFRMLMEHPKDGKVAAPFIEDTIVPLEHYDRFLNKFINLLVKRDIFYTIAGHIGDGSIRMIPMMATKTQKDKDLIMDVAYEVNDLAISMGGSMSVDHNDGLIRSKYLTHQYGPEIVEIFNKIKYIFDPLSIFNPGKKAGLLDYDPRDFIKS